jgi:hypothetical protein
MLQQQWPWRQPSSSIRLLKLKIQKTVRLSLDCCIFHWLRCCIVNVVILWNLCCWQCPGSGSGQIRKIFTSSDPDPEKRSESSCLLRISSQLQEFKRKPWSGCGFRNRPDPDRDSIDPDPQHSLLLILKLYSRRLRDFTILISTVPKAFCLNHYVESVSIRLDEPSV